MIRHFSQVSGTTESSSSCQGVLCAHGLCFLMFLQEVECSALAYNSCLHWISKSARNERLGPFQYFLEYEYSPEQECDLLDSRECVGAFQNHYGPPILQVFLLSFGTDLWFFPTVFIASVNYDDKHLPLIVSDKWPRENAFHTEQILS